MKTALPHQEDFIVYLTNNNYSLETIKNYKRDLNIFSAFLKIKSIKFKSIDKKTIALYKGFLKNGGHYKIIEELEGSNQENPKISGGKQKSSPKGARSRDNEKDGLSARSINRMLSALRTFLRFLIDFDYKNPIAPDAIKLVRTERKKSQVAEFEDLVKLVEFPSTFEKKKIIARRNRSILELFFSTGMRISELCSLNLEDLDLSADRKKIKRGKIFITGKGKKQRFVYLTDRCKYHLEQYLKMRDDQYPALFVPLKGTRINADNPNKIRISVRYIQSKIAKYRKLLGIIVPTSAHSLRHGFATYLAEQGASPAAIQHLLGHESLQTTTRYVHASDKFAEKTHKKYHPLKSKKLSSKSDSS